MGGGGGGVRWTSLLEVMSRRLSSAWSVGRSVNRYLQVSKPRQSLAPVETAVAATAALTANCVEERMAEWCTRVRMPGDGCRQDR